MGRGRSSQSTVLLGDPGARSVLKPSPRGRLLPCRCREPAGESRGHAPSLPPPGATQTYPSCVRCSCQGHLTLGQASCHLSSRKKSSKTCLSALLTQAHTTGIDRKGAHTDTHVHRWGDTGLRPLWGHSGTPGVWALKGCEAASMFQTRSTACSNISCTRTLLPSTGCVPKQRADHKRCAWEGS